MDYRIEKKENSIRVHGDFSPRTGRDGLDYLPRKVEQAIKKELCSIDAESVDVTFDQDFEEALYNSFNSSLRRNSVLQYASGISMGVACACSAADCAEMVVANKPIGPLRAVRSLAALAVIFASEKIMGAAGKNLAALDRLGYR